MGTTPEREKPLYEDTHIKIEYWPDSVDDHRLRIDVGDEPCYYIIPRGILRELARTRRGGI